MILGIPNRLRCWSDDFTRCARAHDSKSTTNVLAEITESQGVSFPARGRWNVTRRSDRKIDLIVKFCVFLLLFQSKEKGKSESKHKYTSWDGSESTSPLRSLPRPLIQDRFSLLTPGSLRSSAEDSIRLMSTDDWGRFKLPNYFLSILL